MQTITVALGERSYPIHIASGILEKAGEYIDGLGKVRKVFVISDDHVAPLYMQRLLVSLEAAHLDATTLVFPHGESTKCLDSLSLSYNALAQSGISRSDILIALGGGVIGDLAGLVAATWLRGIRFVQIPTTLLAQVDSSVGGKVAVDLPQGKNLVGAFHQPSLVLIDPDTLLTLTPEFWKDGLGEVVKYGCIMDEPLFALIEKQMQGRTAEESRDALMSEIDTILAHCIQAKADVVEKDERDTGLRMILNFGHTLAHAIENEQHYTGFSHGCAVAAGMQVITEISEDKGITEKGTAARLLALLTALGLPSQAPDIPGDALRQAMQMDKKHLNSALNLIILDRIGACHVIQDAPSFFSSLP